MYTQVRGRKRHSLFTFAIFKRAKLSHQEAAIRCFALIGEEGDFYTTRAVSDLLPLHDRSPRNIFSEAT